MNKLAERAPFVSVLARLRDIAAELEDCAAELRQLGESIEPDEERLDQVRSRRQLLVELRRKYGDSLAAVVDYAAEARSRLEELTAHDATLAAYEAELATAVAELQLVCKGIGKKRRAAAAGLAVAVEAHLGDLALAGARIEVRVTDTEELPGAGEQVELRIAVNTGSAMGSLSKVASGGELSRVMLAIRLVLSDGPPTMVFDEVDAGIGGEAALCVGRALAELGSQSQVIVVTHLPQVAAFADEQVLVSKTQGDQVARTTAVVLNEEDRVVELSRMLSGSPDSSTARDHAYELLSSAQGERRLGTQ
jgi:DNA repair protein RecN (Recombination protein N)